MCLLGTGASAVAIQVDSKTLMADCSLITLTIDAICKCTTAEETGDITTTDKNVWLVTYPGSASFLPAPWLLNAVVKALSSNPFILIPKAIKMAQAFDQEHYHYKEYITTAADHMDDFILLGLGSWSRSVSEIEFTIDLNDNNLECFKIECHQSTSPPQVEHPWQQQPELCLCLQQLIIWHSTARLHVTVCVTVMIGSGSPQ